MVCKETEMVLKLMIGFNVERGKKPDKNKNTDFCSGLRTVVGSCGRVLLQKGLLISVLDTNRLPEEADKARQCRQVFIVRSPRLN